MDTMDLTTVIKQKIEEEINKEYIEYKNKCLEELDYKIEANRNQIVGNILNGIQVYIQNQEPYTNEPAINIRIETHPIIRMEDKKNG